MTWVSKDGRVFPNKESKVGVLWTDWSTWEEAPPGAFAFGHEENGVPQGLWWKCWWGHIEVLDDGTEVEAVPEWKHALDHYAPFRSIDGHPSWKWDGNLLLPSLTPSILINDRYYKDPKRREVWHGHMQGGIFKSV